MNRIRKIISLFLILAVMATLTIAGNATFSAAGTGIGLAEHALNAYYSGWSYVYGGASAGAVDCSGLIYMYAGGIRTANAQCYSAPVSGYVSSGVPNIHGLGLWRDGHVGVYVGDGMAVDARGAAYGVKYQEVANKWTMWFKVGGVSYPDTGWEYYNGSYYYYEDGEFLTNTSITVDGVSYYLDASGRSSSTPGDMSAVAGSESDDSSSSSSSSTSTTETPKNDTIKLGSSGDRVTQIQERLTELGFYSGDITGYFGEQTQAAFISFQKAAGLSADGVYGPASREIMFSDSAPTYTAPATTAPTQEEVTEEPEAEAEAEPETEAVSEETTEETTPTTYTNGTYHNNVYKIQTELAELGYFSEDATGYYGNVTESAVTKFQEENGLTATGEVDELTYAVIFSGTALENPDAEIENVTAPDEENSTDASEGNVEGTTTPMETVPVTVSPTEATEVILKSAQLASKALEGVNIQNVETNSSNSSRNGSFLVWLVVMIAFMSAAFWVVFSTEKKKKKARYERIRARANRNW